MVLFVFISLLLLFFLAGIVHLINGNNADTTHRHGFHLASRDLPGWLVGITAATSSHSAFMFTAMVGAVIYSFSFIWLLIGWFVGALCAWVYIYPKLRNISEENDSVTLTQLIMASSFGKGKAAYTKFLALALVFLMGFYASAQVIAAQATLAISFGAVSQFIVIFCFVTILLYSSMGGLRSTVYSDALQGMVVIISLMIVVGLLIYLLAITPAEQTSFSELKKANFFELTWGSGIWSTALFISGWMLGGFAEVGAPHVIVRVFAIKSAKEITAATKVYLTWFAVLSLLVIIFAVLVKILMPVLMSVSPETSGSLIYGHVINETIPKWLLGICLAGFVAATISTADSLILAASASISEDMNQNYTRRNKQFLTAIIGLVTFLFYFLTNKAAAEKGVDLYATITLAWALIASVFVAPTALTVMKRKYPVWAMALASFLGALTTIVWVKLGYNDTICYELLPGVFISTFILLLMSRSSKESVSEN